MKGRPYEHEGSEGVAVLGFVMQDLGPAVLRLAQRLLVARRGLAQRTRRGTEVALVASEHARLLGEPFDEVRHTTVLARAALWPVPSCRPWLPTLILADNGERLHDEAALRLAALDQRYTANRREIVRVLAGTDRPLTINEIVDSAPSVPVSSAYRSLTVLADARVVRRVAGADDTGRYELAEDLSGQHHHHLICSTCGTVVDIAASPRLERALAEAAKAAAEESDFDVHEHRIDLVGRCKNCR